MEMIAHNPAMAAKLHISQKVGRDYVAADKASGKFKGRKKKKSRKRR